jgi:hypothetical protein
MEEKQAKMKEEQEKEMKALEFKLQRQAEDSQKKQEEVIDTNKKELKADLKKAEDQIEEDEVKACAAWMIDRVSQDYMDDKFEEALQEVAGSIDQYVGIVNDTSTKQYDDFNKNLKAAFEKNLQGL